MRVVLINPIKLPEGIFGVDKYPPVGLLKVATHYEEKGYKVDIWDGQIEPRKTLEYLVSDHHKPDIIGITVMVGQPLKLAEELTKQYIPMGIQVIWGGPITRTAPYLIPDNVTIDKEYYNKETAWHLINPKNYTPAIYTSVGCPYRCAFCYHNEDQKLSFTQPVDVIGEMTELAAMYGIRSFKIMDDNFFTDKARAIEILEEMRERKYKVTQVHSHINTLTDEVLDHCKGVVGKVGISIEHGDAEVRDKLFNKKMEIERVKDIIGKLKEYDISTIHNFIFGSPEWPLDIENFYCMQELRAVNKKARGVGFGYMSMPATPLTKKIESEYGEYPKTIEFWSGFNMDKLEAKYSPWLTTEEVVNINQVIEKFNKDYNL